MNSKSRVTIRFFFARLPAKVRKNKEKILNYFMVHFRRYASKEKKRKRSDFKFLSKKKKRRFASTSVNSFNSK